MKRDAIDLGTLSVPALFRIYLVPTLLGMLSLCAVTATDGIFVGRGCGSDALAAVNICIAPTMVMMGIGLMLGVGASVVASIHMANDNVKAARLNITQSLVVATIVVGLFLVISLSRTGLTGRILGSSDSLIHLVKAYMPWIFGACMFQVWCAIGLFVVRLDGSPKYAMWCNVLPGLMNVVLDYVFIFPLGMGVRGAALATFLSCMAGGIMVMCYLGWFASSLRLIRVKLSRRSVALTLRNIGYQCKIGISALMGEATMGVLMLMGNLMFMRYMGDDGVGAFSIACYYCPFVFMIGNAIAQSAQPIISYNYGLGQNVRVRATERLAIMTAVVCGLAVTGAFVFFPKSMVGLFLDPTTPAAGIAISGFPEYSTAFVFFIFNLTAIGYFQSVEKVVPSVVFALLRGVVLLVPSFMLLPMALGGDGIWLALAFSECTTSVVIVGYYMYGRRRRGQTVIHQM